MLMLSFLPSLPLLLLFLGATIPKTEAWTTDAPQIPSTPPPPQVLRDTLTRATRSSSILLLPCCYDGLTARLVARHGGFDATFLSGFGVSAAHGMPDTQLISYTEMETTCRDVAAALAAVALEQRDAGTTNVTMPPPLPCIADGDTGYGNAINVHRTVWGYGRAGMAGVMIEDQVQPKRCGHVSGKSVVDLPQAVQRIQAAVDARNEFESLYGPGTGPLILARTDALRTDGLEAAIDRCQAFVEVGADMTFLEAPQSIADMQAYCDRVPGPKLANMLEQGRTPILSPSELQDVGYTMAAYPLTLLSASIQAMQTALEAIYQGQPTDDLIVPFSETKDVVGFTRYGQLEQRYRTD